MPQDPWELLPPIAGGEEDVEEAEDSELRYHKCLFFIHGPRPSATSEIDRVLRVVSSEFGEALGKKGRVVRIYPSKADANLKRTAALNWPDRSLKDRIRNTTDPFLLVIGVNRKDFNPSEDDWAIIWLSDYDPATLHQLFTTLNRVLQDGEETVFDYLKTQARERQKKKIAKRLVDVIELKPSFFGITFNINALLASDND
ncbi:MAG TPA: hypothetical protein VN880_06925 [Solirubrobacteraceae bacterium]|jgi:hypothetical protein|nr:hypothetical protein [Solirubrobacteraceae bacterium]